MTNYKRACVERDNLRRQLQDVEIGSWLALLDPRPDIAVKGPEADDRRSWHMLKAYGLTRADGGYVAVWFHTPSQRDTVRFYLFDRWVEMTKGSAFASANSAIAVERHARLFPKTEADHVA